MKHIRTLGGRCRRIPHLLIVPIASLGLMASAAPAVAACPADAIGVMNSSTHTTMAQPAGCSTLPGNPFSGDTGHKVG